MCFKTLLYSTGRGAFSVVRTGRDLVDNCQIALKRVQDAAPDTTQLRRLMRELALLRRIRGHSNVMEIRNIVLCKRKVNDGFLVRAPQRVVTDVYIITELMMSDLGRLLDHSNSTLTSEQVRACLIHTMIHIQIYMRVYTYTCTKHMLDHVYVQIFQYLQHAYRGAGASAHVSISLWARASARQWHYASRHKTCQSPSR